MAGLEAGVGRNELAAVLFLSAINETMQAYGTLNSSPWTAESFGAEGGPLFLEVRSADDRRAAALKEYVTHAVAFSLLTGGAAEYIAHGPKATYAILGGVAVTNVYLVWLYTRASRRGREAGDAGWYSG